MAVRYFAAGDIPAEKLSVLGVAHAGYDPEDSVSDMHAKRIAAHLTLAVAAVQLLSLVAWSTVAALGAFIALIIVATVAAFLIFALTKDIRALRWFVVAAGFAYSLAFFVSEGCRPLTTAQGRHVLPVLPTILFHQSMGGSLITQIIWASVHLGLFVVQAVVDATIDDGCFTPEKPVTTNAAALVAIQVIVPTILIVAASAFVSQRAVDLAERADSGEEFASTVLPLLDEDKYAAVQEIATEYVKLMDGSEEKRDVAFLTLAVSAAKLFELLPAHLRDPDQTNALVANLNLDMTPETAPFTQTTEVRPEAMFMSSAEPVLPIHDDEDTASNEQRSAAASTRRRPSFKGKTDTLAAENAPRKRRLSGSRHVDIIGSRRAPAPAPFKREAQYIVLFTLPQLQSYCFKKACNMEMVKILLDHYYNAVRLAAEEFDGHLLNVGFSDIYCTFSTCGNAVAAAVFGHQRLRADMQVYMDAPFKESGAEKPFIVVLHADTVTGVVGTDPGKMALMGWTAAEPVMDKLKNHLASTVLAPPIVLLAGPLVHLVSDDFVMSEVDTGSFDGSFQVVERPRARDPDGRPVLVHCKPREIELQKQQVVFDIPDVDALINRLVFNLRPSTASNRDAVNGIVSDDAASPREQYEKPRTAKNRKRLGPEVLEMWHRFDVDGNGFLDADEVKDVFQELGIYLTEEDLREFFDEVDSDRSGTISLDEFAASFFTSNIGGANAMASVCKAAMAATRTSGVDQLPLVMAVWNKYDTNHNNTLESAELFNVLQDLNMAISKEEVDWMVHKLDTNGNGTVEFEEFAVLFGEDNANTKINIAKSRIETVSRVMANKSAGVIFSTSDQMAHEKRMTLKDFVDAYLSFPLFLYISYNMGINTYRVGMGNELVVPGGHIAADMVMDLLFIAWFALKLLFIPREDNGLVVYERLAVLKGYVFSLEFVLDFLVVLPLDFIYIGIDNHAASWSYGFYRLNKLLAMYHFEALFALFSRPFSPIAVRIINGMMYFGVMSHLFACACIYLAREIGDESMKHLVGTATFIERRDTLYLTAILWAFQTMAGQLRGEAIPEEDSQTILMFIAVLVGLPMFAMLLGIIGNAVAVPTPETKYLSKVDSVRDYFSYARRTRFQKSDDIEGMTQLEFECIRYYRHLFSTTGSLDINSNPLSDVPVELSIQVTIETGLEMLRKVPIFKEACENLEFVHELSVKLVARVVEPGVRIMRKGDRGTSMYFITYGDFHVMNDQNVPVWTLRKGNFFGEIALLHNVKRTATIDCSTERYANVLLLDKRDFDEVLQTFPQSLSAISKAAEGRLKEILEKEAEEARKAKEARNAERAKNLSASASMNVMSDHSAPASDRGAARHNDAGALLFPPGPGVATPHSTPAPSDDAHSLGGIPDTDSDLSDVDDKAAEEGPASKKEHTDKPPAELQAENFREVNEEVDGDKVGAEGPGEGVDDQETTSPEHDRSPDRAGQEKAQDL